MKKYTQSFIKILLVFGLSVCFAVFYFSQQERPLPNRSIFSGNEVYESRIYDFQKLGDFGVAVDADGEVLVSDKYLVTFDYRMPGFFDVSDINNARKDYFFYVYKTDMDLGLKSSEKIDLRVKVKEFDSSIELKNIDNIIYTRSVAGKRDYYLKLFVT